jgi:hypothetical protein
LTLAVPVPAVLLELVLAEPPHAASTSAAAAIAT